MKRVVFLCHGNICRSVAAEMIARKWLFERGLEQVVLVSSRALSHEEIGNDIYPSMKRALQKAGIPYVAHRACFLTEKEAEEADVLYYMDEGNAIRLRRYFPRYYQKGRPMVQFDPGFSEIDDPWYTGRFDEVVEQLSQCVPHVLENLL